MILQLIPAIDLMNGKIVRLTRGEAKTAKFYDTEFGTPVEAAKRWRDEGAGKLHIIDLDAAFALGNNQDVIAEVAKNVKLPIQVGGGIRSVETAEKLFQTGITQVILGALAFSDPAAIGKIQRKFGFDSVIVALDNKDGQIMVEGWKTATTMTVHEALEKYTAIGVRHFLITSIAQDGMLKRSRPANPQRSRPVPQRQNHCGRRNRQHRRLSRPQRHRSGRRSHRKSPI